MSRDANNPDPQIRPQLGLWDAVSIIVGIVVGTTIFRGTADVFSNAGSPLATMFLWLTGGVLAWCGAACYAELATAYPRDGGDYEYLNRAFGRGFGFLFAWAQITSIISANIAIMGYAFADYATHVWPALEKHQLWLTLTPILALSALNCLGIVAGKATQNMLTVIKIIGLAAIVIAGLCTTPQPAAPQNASAATAAAPAENPTSAEAPRPTPPPSTNLGLALVFVLYAFGGWTHAAYVAAEVRDQRRNLPRALTFGIAGITVIYIIVNLAYLHALGFDAASNSSTPAAHVLENAVGPKGGLVISLLVMLSALGAINGMILTGTRIYAVWGDDYPALKWLGTWNRRSAPVAAIVLQGVVAALLIALVGSETGRSLFDSALSAIHIAPLPWEEFHGGFATLVAGTAPLFWTLCLLTGVAVFDLRRASDRVASSFRAPLYPLTPLLFIATCLFMLQSSLAYARWLSLIGFAPLAVGVIAWLLLRRR